MKCFYVGNLNVNPYIVVTERESKRTGDKYFAVEVGEMGRGRELQFVPLHPTLIPQKEDRLFIITDVDLAETKSGRYILVPAKTKNDKALVQVYGEEGYRGSLEYTFSNPNPEIIAQGYYAQGEAGRKGGGEEYLVVMHPGDRIDIKRYGRLYGGNEKVVIEWDGEELRVYDPDAEPDFDLK